VLPEILTQFRSRLAEPLRKELVALQAAAAREQGGGSPTHLVGGDLSQRAGQPTGQWGRALVQGEKKVLPVIAQSTDPCRAQGPALKAQAQHLQLDLAKLMRRFGRQGRGRGKVFVSVVRQTETHLRTTGAPGVALAHPAQAQVQSAAELTEDQRARWDTTLTLALVAPQQIAPQSRRLTHRTPLTRGKIVTA
jgi:hypothetical protein